MCLRMNMKCLAPSPKVTMFLGAAFGFGCVEHLKEILVGVEIYANSNGWKPAGLAILLLL